MPGNGGGLHVTGDGDVTVLGGNVRGNTAAAEGGGLWNGTGKMKVIGTKFVRNTATGAEADQGGGALFNAGGKLVVKSVKVKKGTAPGELGSGGAVLNDLGVLIVKKSKFDNNFSSRAGGAIEANAGTTTVIKTGLKKNRTGAAPGNGGGLHLTGEGSVLVKKARVLKNKASNQGGGLWNSETGTMKVVKSVIRKNKSPEGKNNYNDGGSFKINGKNCGC